MKETSSGLRHRAANAQLSSEPGEVVSPQSVRIDGTPHHVKNLQPFSMLYPSSSDESDTEKCERFIYLGSDPPNDGSKISSLPADVDAISETPDDSSPEDESYLRRSTPQKRPAIYIYIRGLID